jgi:hypothetical protein
MSIENILKKSKVTNKDLYNCCLILFKEYLSDDNQILFNSIKYIKYDKHFCNKINRILKKKLDDKTLFKIIKYYIYRQLHIYLNKQDNYEQDIDEHFIVSSNAAKTTVTKNQEKADKEKADKEKAAKEKADKEKATKEKATKEKATKKKTTKYKFKSIINSIIQYIIVTIIIYWIYSYVKI